MRFTLCALFCMISGSQILIPSNGANYSENYAEKAAGELTVTINGRLYFFSGVRWGPCSWAEYSCNNRNMTLASFETKEEYAAVRDWLRENKEYDFWRWIGGSLIDNVWTWTGSGKKFNYYNWMENEPKWEIPYMAPFIDFRAYESYPEVKELGWAANDCTSSVAGYMCEEMSDPDSATTAKLCLSLLFLSHIVLYFTN